MLGKLGSAFRVLSMFFVIIPSFTIAHTGSRERMKALDLGAQQALLSAHLSKEGNELDIYFEGGKNVASAVSLSEFSLQAVREDGELWLLRFLCAPPEERPKDERDGMCSHFVAKVGWLRPDEKLTIKGSLPLEAEETKVRWEDFVPRKYAHSSPK